MSESLSDAWQHRIELVEHEVGLQVQHFMVCPWSWWSCVVVKIPILTNHIHARRVMTAKGFTIMYHDTTEHILHASARFQFEPEGYWSVNFGKLLQGMVPVPALQVDD